MSMTEWAEREVAIACKREKPDREESEWDYGCACYESALKAFKSLMGDGHSGFSIGFTKQILNRLIDGNPLTPIEDTEDVWVDISSFGGLEEGHKEYQCKRMSSLFKDVYPDGTVNYTDVNRFECIDVGDPNISYHSGLVNRTMNNYFPVTMPYFPSKPYKVFCKDFLTDEKNGDFDTVGILYCIRPDGERVDIFKFFKESDDGFVEITEKEYRERELMDKKRRGVDEWIF